MRRDLVVHETATEVDEDVAAHIQEVFAALVEDVHRKEQIAQDVHRSIAEGRTCLVLTQRKEHVEHLVAALRSLGDDPQVLQGGMGTKARAAVADAVAGDRKSVV